MLATLVRAVHVMFVAWVMTAAWWPQWEVTMLHAIVMPFLMIHWILNDDTCFLTWLECWLRGIPVSASLMHSIVSPVYKLGKSQASTLAWVVALLVWAASLYRLGTVHWASLSHAWAMMTTSI